MELFKSQDKFVNSDYYKLMVKIIDQKPRKYQDCISLIGIKELARKIISEGYINYLRKRPE